MFTKIILLYSHAHAHAHSTSLPFKEDRGTRPSVESLEGLDAETGRHRGRGKACLRGNGRDLAFVVYTACIK